MTMFQQPILPRNEQTLKGNSQTARRRMTVLMKFITRRPSLVLFDLLALNWSWPVELPFSWQTVLAVADGLKSSCCCALPVGVDSCCHCLCHCLCGQTVKPALSLLAEYYNTANASSDPWNLPSIEMNHTDGGFVIQQNCPSTRPRANISRYMWHSIWINQFWALQVDLSRCYVVCVL